jgi:1,4-dihydroxy-2-naphthoate octaprenyltransferase
VPESKRRKPKSKPLPASSVAASAKSKEPSPTWYVAVMAGLMVVGVLLVLSRFVFELDRLVLIGGLVCIAIGFLMTTNYR